MKRWIPLPIKLTIILLLFSITTAQSQVRPLGLEEIVQSAKSTFVGTVIDVHYGYDEHHDIVTWTTFRVEDQVTGRTPRDFTMKQFGGIMDGLDTRLTHLRYFTKGERVMLAAYPPSAEGFSNPVGLDQGIWRVTRANEILDVSPTQLRSVAPATLLKHGISSSALLAPATSSAPRAIAKKNFESLVRALAAQASTKGGAAR